MRFRQVGAGLVHIIQKKGEVVCVTLVQLYFHARRAAVCRRQHRAAVLLLFPLRGAAASTVTTSVVQHNPGEVPTLPESEAHHALVDVICDGSELAGYHCN